MKILRSNAVFWAATLAWYSVITWLSSQASLPGPATFPRDFLWFKSAHLFAYGLLSFLTWNSWRLTRPIWRVRRALSNLSSLELITILQIALLATVDELHQMLIPGRTPRVTDVAIDLISTLVVLWLMRRYNALTRGFSHAAQAQSGM